MQRDYDFTPGRMFCDYSGAYHTIASRDGDYITLTDGGRYYCESLAAVLADDLTPEKLRERKEQYEREQAALKARQEAEQDRQRTLYGYADTLKGVKLERVRSTLLKRYRYEGKSATRADHVRQFLNDGGRFEAYTCKGRACYRVWPAAGAGAYFVDVTKTEYDFAKWLEGRADR